MSWFKKLIGGSTDTPPVPAPPDSPEEQTILDFLNECNQLIAQGKSHYYQSVTIQTPTAERIRNADRHEQALYVRELLKHLAEQDRLIEEFRKSDPENYNQHLRPGWQEINAPRQILFCFVQDLLRKKLPLSSETVREMLDWTLQRDLRSSNIHFYLFGPLVSAIEQEAESGQSIDDLKERLRILATRLDHNPDNATRRLIGRIEALAGIAPMIPIHPGEAWADTALADLHSLGTVDQEAWIAFLNHCNDNSGAMPSTKWMRQTKALLDTVNAELLIHLLPKWFALVDKKRTKRALTDHEWLRRCASVRFDSMYSELHAALPADRKNYSEIAKLRSLVNQAPDPWEFLRNFSYEPTVREVLGEHFPARNLSENPPPYDAVEDQLIIAPHMDLLCGLAWGCGTLTDPAIARALAALAISAFRKVPGRGPRAIRIGNGAITALGIIATPEALGRLAFLKVKVKFGGAQNTIDKALGRVAESLKISREELEEMSVPAYGMEEVGKLRLPLADFTASLTVVSSRATELVWLRPDGKPQKTLPAALKAEFADDIKELNAAKKDIEKMLPAQAERLDGLYLQRKRWPLAIWRERYLDHPLVGTLARRLIWNFDLEGYKASGIWREDAIVDRHGNPLTLDEEHMNVTLWHPLDESAEAVGAWRDFLEQAGTVQPFKQAHREVYIVAPAEENTRVYSNRFAAHLLRQHQFNALCSARGWKNKLRLMVDDEYPPATRWLTHWGLRAEFWIEGVGTEYGTDTLESGAYRYLTTDQLRFYHSGDGQVTAHAGGGGYTIGRQATPSAPIPLTDIDPLLFSEIMRDVDLFVGVASVGNDPNWLDGGATETQRTYWQSYSFGELTASAQTRKTILERLIPRLKIASQCHFEDRFLIVQGKLNRYKIHLGSSNILIDPKGKYLCIVPAQAQVDKAGEKLFLPFEGDRTLSVIISKAFLLAADDKITDSTIVRQLG